ncbi:MAG: PKD domain-containing protein [Chitinophagaceae bacterium]|nr:PKD domain-containing protein [Chitinophagaceae bacterium]
MRKLVLPFFIPLALLLCSRSMAQDFSNKGKEFWLAYCYHVGMAQGGSPVMTLYITSDVNTPYTVEIFGVTTIQTGTITAGQVVTVTIPTSYFINDEGPFSNKAIHVTADKPVVVYSYITRSAISGATVCLPTNVLGKEYYAMSFTQVSNEANSYSYFTIVAVEDNTGVEITPSANTKNGWLANNTYTITLNKGQIYQVLGTISGNSGVDLSGSKIRSVASAGGGCKRIAVYSGSGKLSIGCSSAGTSDNLYQQLYPIASWGKKYFTVPSYNRPTNYYRIAKSNPAATVYLNGVVVPPASFVNNIYYEFSNNTPNKIESDMPICVTQYFTTQGCSGNASPYDPDMIVLSPVEQNISQVTLVSSNLVASNPQHHLHVVMRNGGTGISSFKLDNVPIGAASWVIHPQDANYSYLYLTNVSQGYHTLYSDSGFNALAYGYASAESYGYSAGANVKDLYQFVSVQNQYAVVDFPASCKNSPFYFSMTFPYQPTQIIWDFNGLFTNVTINSPVYDSTWFVNGRQLYQYKLPTPYTIAASGTYPVKVIAQNPTSDGCGNQQEIEYDLQVFDPPVADFTLSNNGCTTQPVSFMDASNTGGRSVIHRYWDFGDASTSGISNPLHSYVSPGSYDIRYSLITDVGCLSDTTSHTITLTNPPVASFNISSPGCIGKQITFSDQSSVTGGAVIVKWYWDFGDGSPVVTALTNADQIHTYSAAGSYNATLKVETTTGCQSPLFTLPVMVSVNPVAGFDFPNICMPAGAAQFTNTSTISDGTQSLLSYSWDFGDGSPVSAAQNPLHSYSGLGPYNVRLTVISNNGCSDDTLRSVNTIYAQPDGEFTVNPQNCSYEATVFASTSNPLPGNTISQWHWDFGDGNTSALQNPAWNYNLSDTYTVKHWIVTDKGCNSDTASHMVIVHPQPLANFVFSTPVCETKTINFADVTVYSSGTITNWVWDFGDPASGAANTSSLPGPAHTFASAGSYSVSLVVTASTGCVSGVSSQGITVRPQPKPGFISPEVCLTDAFAQFIDTSYIASGSINAWSWDFGDPSSGASNTSTLQNPLHRYNAIGNYTATLTTTSNAGCVETVTQSFTVNGDIPVADFNVLTPVSLCANDSVSIQNTSTVNFGSITKVEIYWDNGSAPAVFETDDLPAPGKVYKHLYPDFQSPLTKTFSVRFRAYSGLSCVNERTRTIVVNASPKVQFAAIPDICLDAMPYQLTQAIETGAVPGTGIYSGSGVSSTGIFTPSLVGPGTYRILYTYSSTAGSCVDTASATIKVLEPPVADFSFSNPACETQAITFSDNSSTVEGTLTQWTWDFSDGGPLVIRNSASSFTHIFVSRGTYEVKLKVTTSNGCVSIEKKIPVAVNPLPRPNFAIPASACLPNANVVFNDLSAISDGSQSSFTYFWNFGDPASGAVNNSIAKNPSHTYIITGPFNVNLQVTSNAGCLHDTTIILNTIHPQPLASFTADKEELCIGDRFLFTDKSDPLDGTTTQWNWDMGDGSTKSIPSFSYIYSVSGTFNVSLVVYNDHGCKSTLFSLPVTVHPYPVVDAGPDRFVLEGGTITLTPTVTGNDLNYLWTPNLYFAGSNTVANPVIKGIDDQTYLLTVTARGGCKQTDEIFVKVLKMPVIPNIFSPNGDGIHDRWEIKYLESYPGSVVQIYNRYGQMVQRFVNYNSSWDGKINGKDAPIGTYYYVIDPKNGRKPITGFVDIIR